jgi:hypothetical protein
MKLACIGITIAKDTGMMNQPINRRIELLSRKNRYRSSEREMEWQWYHLNGIYLAFDYNICGLEDAFITGVYARIESSTTKQPPWPRDVLIEFF